VLGLIVQQMAALTQRIYAAMPAPRSGRDFGRDAPGQHHLGPPQRRIFDQGRRPYGRSHLSKRRLMLGIGEEAVVGERLEKGDQIGFLAVLQGKAGDQR
jgi:hypothetical protein